MYFVRNKVTMDVVAWGSDYNRLRKLAAGSVELEMRPDLGAGWCYTNVPLVKVGFQRIHPYDYLDRQARQAEFEGLKAWWLAGGNA